MDASEESPRTVSYVRGVVSINRTKNGDGMTITTADYAIDDGINVEYGGKRHTRTTLPIDVGGLRRASPKLMKIIDSGASQFVLKMPEQEAQKLLLIYLSHKDANP